jgi:hypothetical protein
MSAGMIWNVVLFVPRRASDSPVAEFLKVSVTVAGHRNTPK